MKTKFKPWQIAVLSCGALSTACISCLAVWLLVSALLPSQPAASSTYASAQVAIAPKTASSTHTSVPTAAPTWTALPTEEPTATYTLIPPITPSLAPTLTAIPTAISSASLTGTGPAACIPGNAPELATVTNVIDGDTIEVDLNGASYHVQYIGIDAPDSTTQVEPFGPEAMLKNMDLVFGRQVTLVKDVSETDRYSQLLRYVLMGDTFVNYELVRHGFANTGNYPPDISCLDTFRQAESQAQTEQAGLWAGATVLVEATPTSKPVVIQPTQALRGGGGCDPSYPTVCIPSPPPDLDCGDITYRKFKVVPPDPHNFDGDGNGIGCEK